MGLNAEGIQREAMRAGAHMGQVLGAILNHAAPQGPALSELLAHRRAEIEQAKKDCLREKQARERARQAACKAAADQPQLF